jgi:hypothetical protein
MKINYSELLETVTFEDEDRIHPPEAHSIIAEVTGIGKEGNEDKKAGTMSAKPIEREEYRVTGPRCIECGWSRS